MDEAKRALQQGGGVTHTLKNFDFVVYSQNAVNLLVDVKVRKHSGTTGRSLQNWVTEEDVRSLRQWEGIFGDGFELALVFLYWCDAQPPDALFCELFEFGDRWYAVLAIRLCDYQAHMRRRSTKWNTVSIPVKVFDR